MHELKELHVLVLSFAVVAYEPFTFYKLNTDPKFDTLMVANSKYYFLLSLETDSNCYQKSRRQNFPLQISEKLLSPRYIENSKTRVQTV